MTIETVCIHVTSTALSRWTVNHLVGGFLEFQATHPSLCQSQSVCSTSVTSGYKCPPLTSMSQPCLPVSNVGPTKILPFLFLGSQQDALSQETMQVGSGSQSDDDDCGNDNSTKAGMSLLAYLSKHSVHRNTKTETSKYSHFVIGLVQCNTTHAPIQFTRAQLEGTPNHSPELHGNTCISVGMHRWTDTQTDSHQNTFLPCNNGWANLVSYTLARNVISTRQGNWWHKGTLKDIVLDTTVSYGLLNFQ